MNKIKLVDVCDVVVPMRDKPKFFVSEKEGIPRCRIEDIDGKFLNTSKSNRFVSKEIIDEMHLRIFPKGTVLCAVTGASIGTYAITTRPLITNQTFAGLVCKDGLYNEFLYYYIKLLTLAFVNKSVGCAQAYITRETLENLEIPRISYDMQVKMAKILKDIDDKIELNNKINLESEKIVKGIYEYWFIQFDFPDINGKPYKSNGGKMIRNEELKGDIPVNWEVKKLDEIVSINKRGITPIYNENKDLLVINQKCIRDGLTDIKEAYFHDSNFKYDKILNLQFLDTLINSMGTGTLGRISPYLLQNNAVPHSCVTLLRYKEKITLPCFLYLSLKYLEPFITNMGVGSTGQTSLNNKDLGKLKMLIPPYELMEKIEEKILPIFKLIGKNLNENNELAELRDFLLPMLMNGQVTVR